VFWLGKQLTEMVTWEQQDAKHSTPAWSAFSLPMYLMSMQFLDPSIKGIPSVLEMRCLACLALLTDLQEHIHAHLLIEIESTLVQMSRRSSSQMTI
jgi:hypothetical protein